MIPVASESIGSVSSYPPLAGDAKIPVAAAGLNGIVSAAINRAVAGAKDNGDSNTAAVAAAAKTANGAALSASSTAVGGGADAGRSGSRMAANVPVAKAAVGVPVRPVDPVGLGKRRSHQSSNNSSNDNSLSFMDDPDFAARVATVGESGSLGTLNTSSSINGGGQGFGTAAALALGSSSKLEREDRPSRKESEKRRRRLSSSAAMGSSSHYHSEKRRRLEEADGFDGSAGAAGLPTSGRDAAETAFIKKMSEAIKLELYPFYVPHLLAKQEKRQANGSRTGDSVQRQHTSPTAVAVVHGEEHRLQGEGLIVDKASFKALGMKLREKLKAKLLPPSSPVPRYSRSTTGPFIRKFIHAYLLQRAQAKMGTAVPGVSSSSSGVAIVGASEKGMPSAEAEEPSDAGEPESDSEGENSEDATGAGKLSDSHQ
jgi:hypothetical protein